MSHDGSNIADFSAYRVERRIRTVELAVQEDAIAEMQAATKALIEAYQSRNDFAVIACSERADAARRRLIGLTGIDL